MAVLEPLKGGYYLWNYLPSTAAAVIFILLFLTMTVLVSWRMYITKTWFCIPFAIGGFCKPLRHPLHLEGLANNLPVEFVGYCTRASARNKTGRIMPYAVQNTFILLGPALFAASVYMCLSRIIRGVRGERYSLVKPSRLTKIFVAGDVLSFVVQGGAAGLMVTGNNTKTGEGMVIGGLMIQVIMFGLFAITAIVFQKKIESSPTPESCDSALPWQRSMRMLYVVSALIMVRSVFRVAEYAMGNDGYLLKHEWTLYVFDSTLMFAVMVVYFLWYPTWITPDKLESQSYAV